MDGCQWLCKPFERVQENINNIVTYISSFSCKLNKVMAHDLWERFFKEEESTMPQIGKKRSYAEKRRLLVRLVALGCALLIAGSALSALFFL